MKVVNILLMDDHSVVTEGLKSVLGKRSDYVVAGEAFNGSQGIELAQSLKPDLIITDIRMPRMSGIDAVQEIRQTMPNVKAIVLSELFTVISVRDSIRVGITGFVEKETAVQELLDAVDTVMSGKQYFSSNVRQLITSDIQQMLRGQTSIHQTGLTVDEVEMVRMLTEGNSIGQIARIVKKSPKTVDAKRRKIMNKLGLESLANLTKYAISHGITSLEY